MYICTSVRYEHSVCRGSLMTTSTYDYVYIYIQGSR